MKQLLIILITISALGSSCTNNNKYEIQADEKYEQSKESLAKVETKSPERFIRVSSNSKKNLLGQTVINGVIINSAKIVAFKDVALKLSFYSKTGALLEEDNEVIYETVNPGGSKSFRTKYFTPKGTDSVAVKVISAKY